MTLKSFHLVFIACASALAFLLGAWVLNSPGLTGTPRVLAALAAFAVGVGLLIYDAWILRYLRRQR
jgi:hypothetical protein